MTRKLVIFGLGELAELAWFYFSKDSDYEISCFTVDGMYVKEDCWHDRPVIPFEEVRSQQDRENYDVFVAVGYSNTNQNRANKFYEVKCHGFQLASYVSSKLNCWEPPDCGENCLILENTTIQPFVKIGNNTVVGSGSHIGHHSILGNHCYLTLEVAIAGNVTIEDYCFLGANSTIGHGIKIAPSCFIGAGAIVTKDTQPEQVYTADPARLRKIKSSQLFQWKKL